MRPLWTERRRRAAALAAAALVTLLSAEAAAYVGPGAGFALVTSTFMLALTVLSVLLSLLIWPFRFALRCVRRRRRIGKAQVKRVTVLGFDGFDPKVCQTLMTGGELPNLQRLAQEGGFRPLGSTCPPQSPVAWSSFTTGCNPGKHAIFDFLDRDPKSYLPQLSSVKLGQPRRQLRLGRYRIPLGSGQARALQRSRSFWSILGEHGVFSAVLRVPITFPPERFNGVLLSGMCVPDLLGTQGTFFIFGTDQRELDSMTGGNALLMQREGARYAGAIPGPQDPFCADERALEAPFRARVRGDRVELTLGAERLRLRQGELSPWTKVVFRASLRRRISGIARFVVTEIEPALKLYVTAVNVDPQDPVLPVTHPVSYGLYLHHKQGPFATLGLAEDTWALNEQIISDDVFLQQTYAFYDEREAMLLDALDKTRQGLVCCVFDTSDRIQHMFWGDVGRRGEAPLERNNDPRELVRMYRKMDALVGKVRQRLGRRDALIIMSDHGFNAFSRGINLNTLLQELGLLALKEGAQGEGDWLADVDWTRTRAYAFGLNGIFLNLRGREAQGIVAPGEEAQAVKQQIIEALTGLEDEEQGQVAINRVWDRAEIYRGPYVRRAPDLIVGFAGGYRCSWGSAQGRVAQSVFKSNSKAWHGDHCIDPAVVPGVLFTSFAIEKEKPHITDVAPTVLRLLGVEPPGHMDGTSLVPGAGKGPEAEQRETSS